MWLKLPERTNLEEINIPSNFLLNCYLFRLNYSYSMKLITHENSIPSPPRFSFTHRKKIRLK